MTKTSKAMVERFTEELSGSGINYDWNIEETKTSFRASNSFDTMTEGGAYDEAADFTVIFAKKGKMEDFKLQFNGKTAQKMNAKYGLREYLDDTIATAIDDLGPDIFRSKAWSKRKERSQEMDKSFQDKLSSKKRFEIGVKHGVNVFYTGYAFFADTPDAAIDMYMEIEPDAIRKDVYANEI